MVPQAALRGSQYLSRLKTCARQRLDQMLLWVLLVGVSVASATGVGIATHHSCTVAKLPEPMVNPDTPLGRFCAATGGSDYTLLFPLIALSVIVSVVVGLGRRHKVRWVAMSLLLCPCATR